MKKLIETARAIAGSLDKGIRINPQSDYHKELKRESKRVSLKMQCPKCKSTKRFEVDGNGNIECLMCGHECTTGFVTDWLNLDN
jgi:ribosomal protein L37AE/L43A